MLPLQYMKFPLSTRSRRLFTPEGAPSRAIPDSGQSIARAKTHEVP